ncbi:hypothetical protein [Arthrobacter sp. Soil764]|uniref:hypothetical protein n=1 Tax=Arthrobacter sp. Soil764 TaxID=1736403 RepID=UPI0006FF2774|nr:hypothetical protein [Arthrobacter sp. Soil764]KRE89920.1 hypothetical protein ASG86_18775 [Arthrobacter sp. Soil764]
MTTEDKARQKYRLEDEQSVEALLAEAGFPDDAGLRELLLQLRTLRVSEVPAPSAELAAHLGESETADVICLEPGKPRKKKYVVITTLAVAASFGIAGGAAAGNENVRREAGESVSAVMGWFSPPAPATPAPTLPAEAPMPGPAVIPAPASDVPTAALTHGPLPAPPSAPAQSTDRIAAEPPETHEPAADSPEVPSDGLTGMPADAGHGGEPGAKAPGQRGGVAPPNAGGPAIPGSDAAEPKASGKEVAERPDTTAESPTPRAKTKPGPAR